MIKQLTNLLYSKQFYILKNKNKKYFFINSAIMLNISSSCTIDLELNLIINNAINSYSLHSKSNEFIKNVWYYSFNKIKFTGKGFKIKKTKKKNINFFFYHSHINILILKNIIIKKLNKNKLVILAKNLNLKLKAENKILSIKPINIYTKRGLRLSKVLIKKRTGKKAAAN